MKTPPSRTASFFIVSIVYLFAAALGFQLYFWLEPLMSPLWAVFLGDVAATLVVWGFGLDYRNVSMYDPYWSVLPPVVLSAWAIGFGRFSLPAVLLLAAVWYWGIRLTANWALTFLGLGYEDWRYTRYREMQKPLFFHITNLFGFNMMPTVVVFLGMLPGFGVLDSEAGANWLTWLGFAMCVSSATIQLISDTQSHRFRAAHPGEVCEVGLWKRGRHPNYFGEVQFWWGIWVMYVSLEGLGRHGWYICGALAMTALFLGISIPMMERRQLANKPAYAAYRQRTRIMI